MRRTSARISHRQFNSRDVEAVQRVSITIAGAGTTGSVTPSPTVDWTRTEIHIAGWVNSFGGGVGFENIDQSFYLDVNGNDLRATRSSGTANTTIYVDLVSYRPDVIKRIQRGTITNAGVGSNTAALGVPVVLSKAVPRFLMATTNQNINSIWPGRVELQDESTVKYTGSNGGGTNIAGYEVVEKY